VTDMPALVADDERLLLMHEVSEKTRIPIDSLRFMRQFGTGPPSFRLGKRVVYPERQLMQWIHDRQAAEFQDAS
jgi:predicted DNA-binding transcriptional regulator AlpA